MQTQLSLWKKPVLRYALWQRYEPGSSVHVIFSILSEDYDLLLNILERNHPNPLYDFFLKDITEMLFKEEDVGCCTGLPDAKSLGLAEFLTLCEADPLLVFDSATVDEFFENTAKDTYRIIGPGDAS